MVDTIRDYEERLEDLSKTRDYYYSSFLSEVKENDALKIMHEKQENFQRSQLYDKTKQIDQLKMELFQAISDLNKPKQTTKATDTTQNSDKREIQLLLEQKNDEIAEYVKIINEKDNLNAFKRSCCPVCMTDLDENRQWIAFHKCGHRTCSDCYDNLPLTAQKTKLCPICRTLISVSVTLADA